MAEHFIIYCDESVEKGRFYSNFYGGVLVRADDRAALEREIEEKKRDLRFNGEVKWTKITANYADKYVELVDFIFDLIESGRFKVRIMFTQNLHVPPELAEEIKENSYFVLYYHFIKHAFGLKYWNWEKPKRTARFAVFLDDPPNHPDKFARFKAYIASLQQDYGLNAEGIRIARTDVTGIKSHEHNILQCLDIVLGGVQSKLNATHDRPLPGEKRRSKRAKAKAKVYKRIQERLWRLRPNFNVGTSTGHIENTDYWEHPYRHWLFKSRGSTVDRHRERKN